MNKDMNNSHRFSKDMNISHRFPHPSLGLGSFGGGRPTIENFDVPWPGFEAYVKLTELMTDIRTMAFWRVLSSQNSEEFGRRIP